ncbi:MAG TPA: cob(I)yrinic acid a,c-diamide adenosyltransferase [Deltaproteobacteria bacterium]|nr:MAG: cob(I)yrinic acid a,c-diamide adenosyltransferase [Deltaproteobacteria bacterium GWA2_43_19]OGQ12084.1 MAG: cob(I)yrinic acid a,c-diamide adenosyltransferase [Deltaproteobacteria bacterium RIFCSPHIGHO2_02_FULL_43_33]HBR16613.1 cob(I)yrinic acid a,c-diamide adenosyltransferase [Deltaproteobacteria bacterium]
MQKGLIHIYTGEGKGKTTAAIGLAVRAAGQGLKILFAQFFKVDNASSGEKEIFKEIPEVELIRSNVRHPIFTKEKTEKETLKKSIIETFEIVKQRIASGNISLLVLDEINSVISGGWLDVNDIIDFLKNKPEGLEVVLTGRDASVELAKMADYVTEMLKIKHPFDAGVKARKGIEY